MQILLIDDYAMFSKSLKYCLEQEEEVDIVDLADSVLDLVYYIKKNMILFCLTLI